MRYELLSVASLSSVLELFFLFSASFGWGDSSFFRSSTTSFLTSNFIVIVSVFLFVKRHHRPSSKFCFLGSEGRFFGPTPKFGLTTCGIIFSPSVFSPPQSHSASRRFVIPALSFSSSAENFGAVPPLRYRMALFVKSGIGVYSLNISSVSRRIAKLLFYLSGE